eukprot:52749_1
MGSVTSSNIDNNLLKLPQKKNFIEQYELGSEIGTGSFATVHKCYKKNESKDVIEQSDTQSFAVKVINKWYLSDKELLGLRNEIQILKKISHKNIIKLIDIFDDGKYVSMVLELCHGKDLFDEIVSAENKCFPEQKAAEIIYSLSNALQHLHDNGIIHRDIKPENILFGIDGTIKLTDFGLAHFYNDKMFSEDTKQSYEDTIVYTSCGTPHYVAPEVLANKGYNNKADIWSLGVILYILLVGYQPFAGNSVNDVYRLIANGDYNFNSKRWENVSESAKNLIKCLLEVDVNKRYSAKDIKFHPFIIKHMKSDKV